MDDDVNERVKMAAAGVLAVRSIDVTCDRCGRPDAIDVINRWFDPTADTYETGVECYWDGCRGELVWTRSEASEGETADGPAGE